MNRSAIKTCVLGAKGFVGKHFYDHYRTFFPDTIGTHHSPLREYYPLDLSKFTLDYLDNKGYQYAVVACGIPNPKKCQEDSEGTRFINVEKTLELAQTLLKKDIVPILFSSDYVFDGEKKGYSEDSPTCPLNHYGKQKAELEKRAQRELSQFCILRTSKIYGTKKGDGSIFDQMALQLSQDQIVKAAVDQILSPIHINEVIACVDYIQKEKKFGIFNLASKERKSRYAYAKKMAEAFNKPHLVVPVALQDLNDSVRRPKEVILDSPFTFSSAYENIQQLVEQYTLELKKGIKSDDN